MKYNIIYSDPAWPYNARKNKATRFGLGVHGHYPIMTVEEICQLPVQNLAADNCALFLWTTFPRLDAGLEVMKAWGFDYKTIGFLWVKLNPGRLHEFGTWAGCPVSFMEWLSFFGIGYYTKSNPELCLLGIKGKMKPVSNKISNLIYAPREQHSKKPNVAREKIVELFGDLPRVELFARQEVPGWTCLGNEISGEDIRDTLGESRNEQDH